MIRAILQGRKTVTRRVVKRQPWAHHWEHVPGYVGEFRHEGGNLWHFAHRIPHNPEWDLERQQRAPCAVGDRLWVREAWRAAASLDALSGSAIADRCMEAGYRRPWAPIRYEADGARNSAKDWREFGSTPGEAAPGRYRHARFMPRWASRITLEVTAVRVERLQDISEKQAHAEGVDNHMAATAVGSDATRGELLPATVHGFAHLWESINGAGSWSANPWVWAVEFRRVER